MSETCIGCGKTGCYVSEATGLCCSCQVKKYYIDLKQNLLSNEETETCNEDTIICPWCGEIQNMDDQYRILYEDGDHEGNECHSCGKRFTVITDVSYSYSTEREENT